ncbi:type II toxin-antitoxin system RelE/ParE family toxin [Lysobacter sp. F60174L2]|uniref:type II toxin-antitoxin system RelE/ParE family toxin n=1 Tax=Lysobacter sp. F60174L2 TaxID=3459295 RepID=UPI00403DA454
MKRIFMTRAFARWLRRSAVSETALSIAVAEMSGGLVDADLGGGVLKKRVPVPGRGKRGGARTLVATNRDDRWFFVFGFEKNERSNITARELEALQALATTLLGFSATELEAQLKQPLLKEIPDDQGANH